MASSLHVSQYPDWLASAGHLIFLLMAFQEGTPLAWQLAWAAILVISFISWIAVSRRLRAVRDTPTSRIASAAQGYIELNGRGANFPESPLTSHLTRTSCVWERYKVEQKSGDSWRTVDEGGSDDNFLLFDGDAKCVVDPAQAEVITRHRKTWTRDDYRYSEAVLVPGDFIYVLGEFATEGGAASELDLHRDVGELLGGWKQNRRELLQRFDADRDGEISLAEWEVAREEAVRQVRQDHAEIRREAGVSFIRKPKDGRLFLISNLSEERLSRRFVWWGRIHLGLFFVALAGLGRYLVF